MEDMTIAAGFRAPPLVFILRIWYEMPEAEERTLRIQIRGVLTGETRYFQDWLTLIAYLNSRLATTSPPQDE